jgi:hypothetical protein
VAINPNSAFVRVVFDLPTPLAIAYDEVVKASGKSKKQHLADLVTAAVAASKKGKTK